MGIHFLLPGVPVVAEGVVVALLLRAVRVARCAYTLGAAVDDDASGGMSRGGRVLAAAVVVPCCLSHRTFRSWRRLHVSRR